MTEEIALIWNRGADDADRRANARVIGTISKMIKARERKAVVKILAKWPPADVLALFVRLRFKRVRRLLDWLPEDVGIAVLAELDPEMQAVLLEDHTRARLAHVVARLDRTRALRLLTELPRDLARELIEGLPEPDTWRRELAYAEDSAGEVMRRHFIALPVTWTIGQAISEIRARTEQIDRVDALYVVDVQRHLVGYLRVRDLVLCAPELPIREAVRPDVVSVSSEMDQEEVLRLAESHGLRVIAVTDPAGRLIGSITPRELTAVARDEAEEDMLKMAGVSPEATAHDTPVQIVRRRFPWLAGGLVGASVAAMVIGSFETALEKAVILASFIPVVMATAGNAGIQASTVTVQALNTGALWPGETWSRIGRELLGAAMNGAGVGMVVALLIAAASFGITIDRTEMLALTSVLTLVVVTVLASLVGSTVPVILDRLGADPAVSTGIFITTANDVFGVLTFFTFASALYL